MELPFQLFSITTVEHRPFISSLSLYPRFHCGRSFNDSINEITNLDSGVTLSGRNRQTNNIAQNWTHFSNLFQSFRSRKECQVARKLHDIVRDAPRDLYYEFLHDSSASHLNSIQITVPSVSVQFSQLLFSSTDIFE